jgi:hypothetical protein
MLLTHPVLKDHRIDNLSAEDASPPGKLLAVTIKLLKDHHAAASMTLHLSSLLSIRKIPHPLSFAPPRTGRLVSVSPIFANGTAEVNIANTVFYGVKHCISG